MTEIKKKKRVDGQMTGLAGEFFVAGELLKRNFQTSITFGNAKSIDIFAHSEESGQTYAVQVKSLRTKNYFPIRRSAIGENIVYVFVILNKPDKEVDYFIVLGSTLSSATGDLAKYLDDPKFPGINWRSLEPYRNNWQVFV
ncbi:hypothetical protein [Pseudoalteromonas sp. T1lg10]|uniref:hypothetical protein n=1 Tax=Pseudoalteromonas sp. T1lg10 TaxID=2077093 RepID=UPI000CF61B25|nr:hypothetical protein [Pseudoalteromonas sp. T1lg10]